MKHYSRVRTDFANVEKNDQHHHGPVYAVSGERVKRSQTMPDADDPRCVLDLALIGEAGNQQGNLRYLNNRHLHRTCLCSVYSADYQVIDRLSTQEALVYELLYGSSVM